MNLDSSPENQSVLAKRRLSLLSRQTAPERRIGNLLTELGVRAIPQKGFFTERSHFIVDFYLPRPFRICLEIDGKYHESDKQRGIDYARTRFLEDVRRVKVIRMTNEQAMDISSGELMRLIEDKRFE